MKQTPLYILLLLTLFSCYKLEENDKRYTKKKLLKMLEGTWEIQDYQIDGVSYLDSYFNVNPKGNCKTFTFVQWNKNTSEASLKGYYKTGFFSNSCSEKFDNLAGTAYSYSFVPKKKELFIGGPFILDSIHFFYIEYENKFTVLKLENSKLVLESTSNSKIRKVYFNKL